MAISPPLTPTGAASLFASSTSSRVAIPTAGSPTAVMVANLGPNDAYIAFGNSSVVATVAGGIVVRAGADPVLFTIPAAATNLAAITPSAALGASLNIVAGT